MKNILNQRKKHKRNKISGLILFTIILFFLIPILNNSYFHPKIIEDTTSIKSASVVNHEGYILVNPTFNDPIEPTWYSTIDGDLSDVQTITSPNQAGFKIVGDSGVLQVDDALSSSDWSVFKNPKRPVLPDTYSITSAGAEVYHYWDESVNQTRNTPSIHWKRNIQMPVNMSDYIITSASLEVVYNATVTVSPHAITGAGIDRNGDVGLDAYAIGDFAEFYILISDIDNTQEYQLAYYQTVDLGRDDPPTPSIADTIMNSVPENVLISLLSAVLSTDNYNFTITMGIDIYCEDNEYGADEDQWDSLLFKSLNLTFSYVKRIDQFTTLAWNQDLNEISGSNVYITDANLKFKFKIDQNWTESSQNSRFRIFINDRKYDDPTLNLIDYVYSTNFREAKTDGYDIVSKILPYENFTFRIEVFLAENFGLEQNITISITDVYLYVTWTETFSDLIPEPWLFLGLFIIALIAAIVITGYLIAYQTYLKYPIPVRKVRKYSKTLNDIDNPKVPILPRDRAFKLTHEKYLKKSDKALRGASMKPTQTPETPPSKPIDSLADKPLIKKE